MMKKITIKVLFCTCLSLIVRITSQSLQTGNGNGLPTFMDYLGDENNHRIYLHQQAIINTYRFNSCGNITEWGADVFLNEQNSYALDFQIWRPSPTVDDSTGAGCYSLVGNNRFTAISLSGGVARVTPSPQDQLPFKSGDVLGFYVASANPVPPTRPPNGVVLQITTSETVWYASIAPSEAASMSGDCPYSVGRGGRLDSSTLAAPVLLISTTGYPCPMPVATSTRVETPYISTMVPQSSPQPSPSITPDTGNDVTNTPVSPAFITQLPSDIERESIPLWLIITIAVVATVIIALLVTVIIIAVFKRRQVTKTKSFRNGFSVSTKSQSQKENDNGSDAADYDKVFDNAGLYVPTAEARAHWEVGEIQDETTSYTQLKFFKEEEIYWTPALTTYALYTQLASKKYREISRNQIRIVEQLGSGQFGEVSKAVWSISGATKELAVKTLRAELPEEEKVRFLQEAAIMGQFSHPNVVKLYGVVTVGEPILVCIELMTNGDLQNYLRSIDPNKQNNKKLERQLIRFSQEIASGMNYLSKKSFVHRDLAARNVLLNGAFHCKIGDFGMARDLMDDTYYTTKSKGAKIPVKWTAPEAIFYKKYSTDSDVWSYGMVLFEIWSVGKEPFSEFTIEEAVKLIQKGHCQPCPPGCPRTIYILMVDCWTLEHRQRPSFEKICAYLQQPFENFVFQNKSFSVINKAHTDSDDDLIANSAYCAIAPRSNGANRYHNIEMDTRKTEQNIANGEHNKNGPLSETQ